MENTVTSYLDQLKKDRSRRRRTTAVLVCLSLVVAGGTTWALHLTGESQTSDTYCGYTEHQHSEECIGKALVCGYDTEGTTLKAADPDPEPGSGHIHSGDCYETKLVLTCTQAEHTHSAEIGCYDRNGNLICERPEHTHSVEIGCYTKEPVLICGMEESAEPAESETESHVHTDECYEITYLCGKVEHQHTLSCYSNPNADVETAADWEQVFANVELSGVYADDLLSIAKTQLGYRESIDNFQVVLDGAGNETNEMKGYTRYGAWYGNAYGDWCAMFVSFCLNYAQVPETAFPRDTDCESWLGTLSDPEKGYGLYRGAAGCSPSPGDLVFFDRDMDGSADYVGIVELVDAEQGKIGTIEGDASNQVQRVSYDANDPQILGYGVLPENPELEKDILSRQTLTATIYSDSTYTAIAPDEGNQITVKGEFPDGAAARAYPVAVELENQTVLSSYQIEISLPDGSVYEPEKGQELEVCFTLPELEEMSVIGSVAVYEVPGETDPEKLSAQQEGTDVVFTVSRFSTYAAAVTKANPPYMPEYPMDASIRVKKVWADGEEQHSGEQITVHLLANGEDTGRSVTLNSQNNWQETFQGLPRLDRNGNVIVYTVAEDTVEGYEAAYTWTISKDGAANKQVPGRETLTFTITNSQTEPGNLLPNTGGAGTILYTTGGLLALGGAGALLLYNHKKRRKEDFAST